MTKDQFQNTYHEYMTRDGAEAKAEAERVNAAGIDGGSAIAVNFDGWWCLMLKSAFEFTREMGIESKT